MKTITLEFDEYQAMIDKIKAYEKGGVYFSSVLSHETFGHIFIPTLKYRFESANSALNEFIFITVKQEKEIKELQEKLAVKNKTFFQRLIEMI